MVSRNVEWLGEFIKMYESEPCVWQIKSKDYRDRLKREMAYKRLTDKLKEIEPSANKEMVVKKINSIRSSYRKECKKIKASVKLGTSAEYVYKPKLWYFKLMRFLDDQETIESYHCTTESHDESDSGEHTIENMWIDTINSEDTVQSDVSAQEESAQELNENAPTQKYHKRLRPCKRSFQTTDETDTGNKVLQNIKDYLNLFVNQEDRFDIIGKNVAIKLRGLPKQQMLIAEKIINETLFEAEMGTLSLSHTLMCESPFTPTLQHRSSPNPSFATLTTPTKLLNVSHMHETYNSSNNSNPILFQTVPQTNTMKSVHQEANVYPISISTKTISSADLKENEQENVRFKEEGYF